MLIQLAAADVGDEQDGAAGCRCGDEGQVAVAGRGDFCYAVEAAGGGCAALQIEPGGILFLAGGPLEEVAVAGCLTGEGCQGEGQGYKRAGGDEEAAEAGDVEGDFPSLASIGIASVIPYNVVVVGVDLAGGACVGAGGRSGAVELGDTEVGKEPLDLMEQTGVQVASEKILCE